MPELDLYLTYFVACRDSSLVFTACCWFELASFPMLLNVETPPMCTQGSSVYVQRPSTTAAAAILSHDVGNVYMLGLPTHPPTPKFNCI